MNAPAAAPTAAPAQEFAPLWSADEAIESIRDALPNKIACLKQMIMLGAMNEPQMTAFFQGEIDAGGGRAADFLKTGLELGKWLDLLPEVSDIISDRVNRVAQTAIAKVAL